MKKENTSIRLKQIMSERNLKQVDIINMAKPFCDKYKIKLGKSDLSQFVSGKVEPGQSKLTILGLALNVSETWLMGYDVPMERTSQSDTSYNDYDNIIPMPEMNKIPLVGTIACGTPILAEENIEDLISMPKHIHADFALQCKGDSMINARIFDGDIVYIRQQPDVDNGQIAAVLIDNEATLKRVYKYPNKLVLQPENPAYEPLVYVGYELEQIRILGKAVAFTSTLR